MKTIISTRIPVTTLAQIVSLLNRRGIYSRSKSAIVSDALNLMIDSSELDDTIGIEDLEFVPSGEDAAIEYLKNKGYDFAL